MRRPIDPATGKSLAQVALERTNGAYAMVAGLVETFKTVRTHWLDTHTFTVSIAGDDPAYPDAQEWLLSAVPVAQQKALAMRTEHGAGRFSLPGDDEDEGPRRVYFAWDSTMEQRITVDGHMVRVNLQRADTTTGRSRLSNPDKIVFRCTSRAGQDAVKTQLTSIVGIHKRRERKPQLYQVTNWGDWQRRSDVPPRSVESVILRAGLMEDLIADLGEFLDRERDYVRLGSPYHRAYLLQGPPGTGKTSIAKALAHCYGLDLWHVPLGDLNKDGSLSSLLAAMKPRSVLLLEDVDVYQASTTRKADGNEKVTLAGLLQALDGVATPHGLITVLTSNTVTVPGVDDPDGLDEALVRPGRVDRIIDIGHVDDEQATRLFRYFYDRAPAGEWKVAAGTSCAALAEVFKRHMYDPAAAEHALVAGGVVQVASEHSTR